MKPVAPPRRLGRPPRPSAVVGRVVRQPMDIRAFLAVLGGLAGARPRGRRGGRLAVAYGG